VICCVQSLQQLRRMSADLQWMMIRNNSCFLMKRKSVKPFSKVCRSLTQKKAHQASSQIFTRHGQYRQVLLRRILAIGILSVPLPVCHDPVVYEAQVR